MNQKEKDERFIQYWENCIKLGRLPYSLINGILAGIVFFILTNLAYYLFTDETLLHLDMNGILSALICYLVGVFFFYVPIWNVNSFKYHVILKKKTGKKKFRK
ncbi:MAG: hypothetical protein Q4A00_01590 [Flavobacteriaceae bacterium]|nr:hypothetical protein [Flavobacteriaceae bacterium]